MYIKSVQVGVIGTNCYLLGDEETGSLAIIDPGDEANKIEKLVKTSGMEVKMILLTHGHFDHVTGVPGVLKLHPGIPVYINSKDQQIAENPSMYGNGMGKVENLMFYSEGDTVQLGNLSIRVLETPGHTPGSVTLMVGDVLFTGDTLFAGSCGRTDFPGGSYRQMLQSLKRLGNLEGNYAVYPGHEGSSNLNMERKYNGFMTTAMNN